MTELNISTLATDLPTATSIAVLEHPFHRGYAIALLALTLFSGFLCFNRLSVPPLLIDECFTYWRVCGNLDQLLDTLRNDAFMPLHYELLNWIGQGFPIGFGHRLIPSGIMLTPTVMRFIPALCGTLMTPVMYFVARQMFNRRTALIAAAFITCSAYSVFFSRNAKMYAPAWMFETLAVGCFWWWLRTWRRDAWLCWIFAGIAAGGFHAITLLVIPLAPLYFISVGRFSGWRIPLLVLGLVLILFPPAIYYGVCNLWTQNSGGIVPGVMGEPAADANWDASGLNWIEPADNSIRLPLTALDAFLSGLEWSGLDDLNDAPPILKRFTGLMIALAVITYASFVFGALPWPQRRAVEQILDRPQPGWRALFWIALWIVIPTYGFFYCRSVERFNTPVDWIRALYHAMGLRWIMVLGIAAVMAQTIASVRWLAKFIAIFVLLILVYAAFETARNQSGEFTLLNNTDKQMIFAAATLSVLFHYSGSTNKLRVLQSFKILAVVLSVLVLCEGAAVLWRHLHEISMRKHPELPWRSIWQIRYVAIVMPAVWLGAAALVGRLPSRYLQVAAVLVICFYNTANVLAREYIQTNVPLDRAMADMFLAQPKSDTRTYFELRALTDNNYYRPLAAYNACMAAGLKPAPADFRSGYTWPFQWGTIATVFKNSCIYNSSVSAKQLRRDTAADPNITRVIIWDIVNRQFASTSGDTAVKALGKQWIIESDEKIVTHWYWTWTDTWTLRRRTLRKIAPS